MKNKSLLKALVISSVMMVSGGGAMPAHASLCVNNGKAKTEIKNNPSKKHSNPLMLKVSALNTMAAEALDKKQYDKCIDLSKRVLITSEKKEYAIAAHNIGAACMGQKKYDDAIKYFTLALKYLQEYGIARPDKTIDYETLFGDSLQSALDAKKIAVVTKDNVKSK